MAVLLGVAGWSYADWRGIVYARSGGDPLRTVAGLCDLIEINSSFYRVPRAETVASWSERTADLDTRFTAKLPQTLTHDRQLDAAQIDATRAAFAPLAASGRLRALLAQFSYRFVASVAAFEHLRALRDAFGDLAPVVIEVRHGSWREPRAQAGLLELGCSVAHLDYAGSQRGGFDGAGTALFGDTGLAYFRLHGRSDAWFAKDAGRDAVYDWEYAPGEVAGLVERLRELVQRAPGDALVVANNHFEGKAVKLTVELAAALDRPVPRVPATLAERYPSLRPFAGPTQGALW